MAKGRTSAVRLSPVGRAVLAFGVAAPELAGRRFTIEGRRIAAVKVGKVSLLYTYVDRAAFGEDDLERLRGDAEALTREARIYERALERAAVHAPVVPARLLTIYGEMADVDALPAEALTRWSRDLTRLGEKREMALLCYRGPHAMPIFEPYALRISGRAVRTFKDEQPDDAVAAHVRRVWDAVVGFGSAHRRLRPVSARERFGAALLVDPTVLDRLRAALAEHAAEASTLGCTWYLDGPRLAFSFV